MYSAVLQHEASAETKPCNGCLFWAAAASDMSVTEFKGDSCSVSSIKTHILMRNLCPFWLCSVMRKISRFKCLSWPDSFGLTAWISRRHTQQRKAGKCQERLTKHIPQRLPFKSKTGGESARGGRSERERESAQERERLSRISAELIYLLFSDLWRETNIF